MSREATARARAGVDPAVRLNKRNAFKMPDWQLVELGETTMRGQEDTGAGRKVVDADAYLSIRHVAGEHMLHRHRRGQRRGHHGPDRVHGRQRRSRHQRSLGDHDRFARTEQG
jgi:hypothetical protein